MNACPPGSCSPAPEWLKRERLCFFDLETTGLLDAAPPHRVVQLACVTVDAGEVTARRSWLVDPERDISPGATEAHGYTREKLAAAGARPFAEVWPEAEPLFRDRVLAGYNVVGFDIPFLLAGEPAASPVWRQPSAAPALDVLLWVRYYDRYVKGKGRHRLGVTAERHGVKAEGSLHDALVDLDLTAGVMRALARRHRRDWQVSDIETLLATQARYGQDIEQDREAWLRRKAGEKVLNGSEAVDPNDPVLAVHPGNPAEHGDR